MLELPTVWYTMLVQSRPPEERSQQRVGCLVNYVFVVSLTLTCLTRYIKELADRIHHIEGKLGGQSVSEALGLAGLPRRESSGGFSPAIPGDESSRKRPFSSISGDGFSTPSNNRQTAWGSEPRPTQPYQTPSDRYRTSSYSANGLGPQPIAPRPDGSRPAAMMDGLSADAQEEQGRDVDDGIFHG